MMSHCKIDPGETLYILGRNGSGKTTLLSCLAGLLGTRLQVKFYWTGKNLQSFNPAERARMVGLIPQMHTPAFGYTVNEMVMMGRAPYLGWLGSPNRDDQAIVDEALAQLGLFELRDRPYTEISGGEQQLVLIARGLAQKCQLLLMDEPTAHLDLSNQHRILEIVSQLADRGLILHHQLRIHRTTPSPMLTGCSCWPPARLPRTARRRKP